MFSNVETNIFLSFKSLLTEYLWVLVVGNKKKKQSEDITLGSEGRFSHFVPLQFNALNKNQEDNLQK